MKGGGSAPRAGAANSRVLLWRAGYLVGDRRLLARARLLKCSIRCVHSSMLVHSLCRIGLEKFCLIHCRYHHPSGGFDLIGLDLLWASQMCGYAPMP
jgi:hypothetical protein